MSWECVQDVCPGGCPGCGGVSWGQEACLRRRKGCPGGGCPGGCFLRDVSGICVLGGCVRGGGALGHLLGFVLGFVPGSVLGVFPGGVQGRVCVLAQLDWCG